MSQARNGAAAGEGVSRGGGGGRLLDIQAAGE